MVKIAFCAGHGSFGTTAGKRTPDGEHEWNFNNKVALAFENEFSKYENVQLLRTDDRTGKTDIDLPIRTNNANKWGADYYISFHHNANKGIWFNGGGVETFVYTGAQPKSLALAKAVHPALVTAYGLTDRGIKSKNLHIVRETKMPAILVEGGFMDSTVDIVKLRDDKVLENAGRGMAKAMATFLGLKLKPVAVPAPAQPTNPVATPTKPEDTDKYTVKKGDTLWAIATVRKVTVAQLKEWNGLKSDILQIGQKLIVVKPKIVQKIQKIKVDKLKNFTYIYSKPSSLAANRLGQAKKNSTWELVKTVGSYYEVKYNGKTGYIAKQYCSLI